MREESARPDRGVAERARRQHGVVADWQLVESGLSTSAISRRVASGRLHRVHRGVYAVGHAGLSRHGAWLAAVLACGKSRRLGGDDRGRDSEATVAVLDYWGAALSHRSAAQLWELLPVQSGNVDISVPGHGGRKRRQGIRLHRSTSLSPASVTLRDGIPLTKPGRTIADLRLARAGAHSIISPRELRRAIRQAEVLGLPLGEDVASDRTRSDLEGDFLALCRGRGLPEPEVNVRISRHLVDFLWRERRLIVETDSYLYHRGRVAFQDDRGRDLDLRARGFDVVRISERQLEDEADLVAEVVGHALRVGADAAGQR
jgi:very-short-patch-repair endonuclease